VAGPGWRLSGLAAAFDRTFWWAVGFAVAGALPALLIGRGPQPSGAAKAGATR
jgi:hypothetical protein